MTVSGGVGGEEVTWEHNDAIGLREMGHCRLVQREGVVDSRWSRYVAARVEQWLGGNRSEEEAKPIRRIPGGAQPLGVGDWIQLRGRRGVDVGVVLCGTGESRFHVWVKVVTGRGLPFEG